MLSQPAKVIDTNVTLGENIESLLGDGYETAKASVLDSINTRNASYFEDEITKLDTWADGLKQTIEQSIKELDKKIRQVRKNAKLAPTLEEKLELQKKQKKLEAQRSKDRRELFDRQDEVDLRQEDMILAIEERLEQKFEENSLFSIQWQIS